MGIEDSGVARFCATQDGSLQIRNFFAGLSHGCVKSIPLLYKFGWLAGGDDQLCGSVKEGWSNAYAFRSSDTLKPVFVHAGPPVWMKTYRP
jgi:hypothetical protein